LLIQHPRWRRLGAATAAFLAVPALAACSASATKAQPTAASTAPSTSTATPTATATTADPAAAAALAKALTQTKALRSYAFTATQTLRGGAQPQVTSIAGRAVRPAAIAYQLSVGGKAQQVIKVSGRTYLRVPPAAWKALAKPSATVDPLASLLPLLTNLTEPALHGTTLSGTVSGAVLSQAKLAPAGASGTGASPVAFTLDKTGHVQSVRLQLTVKAGTKTLTLDEVTTYSALNRAPAITAPGTVKK
jgi:hypothetical protein